MTNAWIVGALLPELVSQMKGSFPGEIARDLPVFYPHCCHSLVP